MSVITLNEETKPADLIALLKPYATVGEDGVTVLDTANIRTKEDVEKVLAAKTKVKEQLNEVKTKLSAYVDVFGDDLEDAKEQYDTLKASKGPAVSQEELLELKKQLRSMTKERDKIKADYDGQAARIAELDRRELSDRKNAKFEGDILKTLDPKYDKQKARTIWGDLRERVKFREDDPSEFDDFEQGKSVADAIRERLDLYGAYVNIQGGKGHPGNANPQNGKEPKSMFEEAASQLKL